MIGFLQHQVDLYMKQQRISAQFSSCSYMEGLAEAADALKDADLPLYMKIVERIEIQAEIPRLLQKKKLSEDDSKETKKYVGLFLENSEKNNARNDFTQHCVILLLKADKVLNEFE